MVGSLSARLTTVVGRGPMKPPPVTELISRLMVSAVSPRRSFTMSMVKVLVLALAGIRTVAGTLL